MDRTEYVSDNKATQSCVMLDPKPQQVQIILQSFVNFLQKAHVKESTSMSVNSIPMINQPSSSSMVNYLSYRKNVHERMSQISNNVSQMIIESCTSIDNICNKVRECLTDMHFNTVKINSISEISQYGVNGVQSSYNMEACMEPEKHCTNNNEDTIKSQSEVSVIESVHDDFSQSLMENGQRTLTPFFTIIQEDRRITIQKTDSKRQMLRAKNKLSLSKLNRHTNKKSNILEAFKSALMTNADIDEYEILDKVVEDMNQEITRLSSTLIDMKNLTATKVEIETRKNMPYEDRKVTTAVAVGKKTEEVTKKQEVTSSLAAVPYVESNPSMTEAIPEGEKAKLSESIAQLVPDVYRRPAVTDLHIKLLVQIEANDSYICFQRLMNRNFRGKLRRRKSQLQQLPLTETDQQFPFVDTNPPPPPAQKTISNSSSICCTPARSTKEDLKKKYADSLWFSDKQIIKKPHDKRLHKSRKHTGLAGSQASLASTLIKSPSKSKPSRPGVPMPDRSRVSVRRSRCRTALSRLFETGKNADMRKSKSSMSKRLLDSGNASKHQVRVINDTPPSPSTRYKLQCMKARNMLSSNRRLGYLDILDDLTEKDLLPLQSEYPRRDNIIEEVEHRDVEDTYLYKILHGKYNSKTTWSHLIEPGVECSDENCQMCSSNGKRGQPKNGVDELQTFNNENFSKEQVINKLMPYMSNPENSTAPAVSNHPRSVTAWPVQVLHDKKLVPSIGTAEDRLTDQSPGQAKLPAVLDHHKLSKEQIIKKLLPYMTDPSNPVAAASHFRTVTVLPVQVTYDKHQVPVVKAEQPTKMTSTAAAAPTKLPLLPMKEPRVHAVRATWAVPQQQSAAGPSQHQTKPLKVVYDGITRKPLPTPTLVPNPPPSPPPPTMNMSINLTTKAQSSSARGKDDRKLRDVHQKTSRSFSPRGFSSYCNSHVSSPTSVVRRPSSQSGKTEPAKQTQEKILPKPQPAKKFPYVHERRLPKNSIYGKTVQQQLVNFVERQTDKYSVPRPRYAQPTIKHQTVVGAQASPTNQSAAKGATPPIATATVPSPKNLSPPTSKNSPVAATSQDRPKSIPSLRHKQMLAHLKGLKDKNDAIQTNIQKAINVIESKMVHILSTPGDSSSVEAFDDMEKEITNVLSMMKNQDSKQEEKTVKKKKITDNHPDKIEEEFTTISDELFKKLDQILDSEMSRSSSIATTEHTDKLEHVVGTSKKATEKNFLSSSMTTTTSVEEMTDGGTRRKKPHRKGDKSRKFSAVSSKNLPEAEHTSGCSGDQKKETSSDSCTNAKQEKPEDTKKQSSSEDTNSKGDFVDYLNATTDAIRTSENINTSITIESDKDVLDTKPKTEDIVSLDKNDSEVDLLASIDFPEVPAHIPEIPMEEPETSKQIAEEILQSLWDAPYLKDIPKVLFEISNDTPHIPEHDVPRPIIPEVLPESDPIQNDQSQEESKQTDQPEAMVEQVDQTAEIIEEPEVSAAVFKSETENETGDSFPDNVNKIIQRVEDIYSQLEDIQNTDVSSVDEPKFFSAEELSEAPRFKDESSLLPKINSQEFLTPFMQAVKEKRTNLDSPKNLERSPSLYNVLTFLDTLTNIRIDLAGEVHIARLVHYAFRLTHADVWYLALIEHDCLIEPPPSCLKKNKKELKRSKQKKVSFLVRKEDKESQVVTCPLHNKIKLLKVSSEQFPPIDWQKRDEKHQIPTAKEEEREEKSTEESNEPETAHHSKPRKTEVQKVIEAEYEDAKCQHHQIKIPVFKDLENSEETEQTSNEVKMEHVISKNILEGDEILERKTTSTQVYYHIEKTPNQRCLEETINLESSVDGEMSDTSNASSNQPKVTIYIDNSDDSIPKVVSFADGAYGKDTILKVQDSKLSMKPPSKVVVFREAVDAKGILRPIKDLNQFKSSFVPKRNFLTLSTRTVEPVQGELSKIGDNKTLLKSFYAIVYIIMFTALNMEYRCA